MNNHVTLNLPPINHCTIAIIGLGYVGLPLSLEFGKPGVCLRTKRHFNRSVIGFDVNIERINELRIGLDRTNECSKKQLDAASNLFLTNEPDDLTQADVFIVTVPTPIDNVRRPDLKPLKKASKAVGLALKARQLLKPQSSAVVIYESTVFPGATEEVCIPILEQTSNLKVNNDFFCGYSPERINPGDKTRTLTSITKLTSGSTHESAKWIDCLYGSIIKAGTHLTSSINVAEAAKVIENTQRDLNIALVNEFAIIFSKLGIDTLDVLEAAGTKWNFLSFRPGLVGGHCIGVDPYYLTHRAEQAGYHPEVVLAGRRINDRMGEWIARQVVLNLAKRKLEIVGAKVLILGLTFKEDCPDLRNSKVFDLCNSLKGFGLHVDVHDPYANPCVAQSEYGLSVTSELETSIRYSSVIVAVAHKEFTYFSRTQWSNLLKTNGVLLDLKGIVPRDLNPIRI